jgi:hypothetical protein
MPGTKTSSPRPLGGKKIAAERESAGDFRRLRELAPFLLGMTKDSGLLEDLQHPGRLQEFLLHPKQNVLSRFSH